MRLRSKPWAEKELSTNPAHVLEPGEWKGRWQEVFGNRHEIWLEIGCGKGGFLSQNALAYPERNFVGMERAEKILAMALRRGTAAGASENLRFMYGDARYLEDYFDDGEIGGIFINFCDPWRSRGKWRKRRLTHRNYLAVYRRLMGERSRVFFKTDNQELFDFSLTEFQESGWRLSNVSQDLYHDGSDISRNIATEYEERFSAQGMPIYRLEAYGGESI